VDAHTALHGPFGEHAGCQDLGWDLTPQAPHFNSRAIFFADGGTISQAEAIVGHVQDDQLGTVAGSTTRGWMATSPRSGGRRVSAWCSPA
jgi:hypothetical protein